MNRSMILSLLLCHLLFPAAPSCRRVATASGSGRWTLLQNSIGITAMHMQLLNNDRVIIFDRTDFGHSNLSLPLGKCRRDAADMSLRVDCTAHSVKYDIESNTFRPLTVQTDIWCSSGSVAPDGRLVQAGGFNDGERRVRIFRPCFNTNCDWEEIENGLALRRWYATSHVLPDGSQIIVGGRREFSYEFLPKRDFSQSAYFLRFLVETFDPKTENNLYPFALLNVDGNLFIFANNRAILFDYKSSVVVRNFPEIPGGDPRNYPSTGSAVLLPLKNLRGLSVEAEVLVCGGAPRGSFFQAQTGVFVGALNTCGRIKITDPSPTWVMETMPVARVMGDMILLPNGDVLIVNGASAGTAGWQNARDPVLMPVIYRPDNPEGTRFEPQNPTTIPRMYHSSAILLRDGRVLVGGSNPNIGYTFTDVPFPTELSLEAFLPPYLDSGSSDLRPKIWWPGSHDKFGYGQLFAVRFSISGGSLDQNSISVTMVAPSFTTHSFAMSQRLLMLYWCNATAVANSTFELRVMTPGSGNLAPPGYYILFLIHQGIPGEGVWVQIQ
ncbi:aldehyde oxidase GLOX-like [Malania oleifera]|uniref:aldehyde oxidase GLOX-like n=1 Tax=Malania oleifera TaxID=397392 RepID=UPI0025ADB261|nr:aldehyde oxidase GLOX-like [Malania oleifera]